MRKENNNNIIYSTILLPEIPSCDLWRVRKLSDTIENILICVLKINEGLTGLERYEGE